MAKDGKSKLYMGVDVGGTKVLAALVRKSGAIVARKRCATPRGGTPEDALAAILKAMDDVLEKESAGPKDLAAIGLAVPGVADPDEGLVVFTPNMNLSGLSIVSAVKERFGVPVAPGDAVNMGTLGEKWLGAAQGAQSAVGIFVGTGIGGGVIVDGKILRGSREAAGEIGHIVMEVGGPLCGCGNEGCLEALASRSAIERDIRQAITEGRKTIITDLMADDQQVIKSSMLKRALSAGDPVVTEIMTRASEIIGYACLTVRHLLDPQVIVLGGGVIEACSKFVMPIVQQKIAGDALPGARPGCYVAASELGDDAVVLGAVALAQQARGDTPFRDALKKIPDYPAIKYVSLGEVAVGKDIYKTDIYIRGDGKVKQRDEQAARDRYATSHKIGPEELAKVCKGRPALLVIGMGRSGMASLTVEAEDFLRQRDISFVMEPNQRAVKAYNNANGRKALVLHVSC